MIFADGTLALVLLALWVFCLIDVITSSESEIRNLPKMAWLFIVLILPDIGSIAWLVAGRNWQGRSGYRSAAPAGYPEYDRPGRAVPADPDDDEAFLKQVRERAEAQRREYQQRRKRELQEEHDRLRKRPEPES